MDKLLPCPYGQEDINDALFTLSEVLKDGNGLRLWPSHIKVAMWAINAMQDANRRAGQKQEGNWSRAEHTIIGR